MCDACPPGYLCEYRAGVCGRCGRRAEGLVGGPLVCLDVEACGWVEPVGGPMVGGGAFARDWE